jgi:hypothetical protein
VAGKVSGSALRRISVPCATAYLLHVSTVLSRLPINESRADCMHPRLDRFTIELVEQGYTDHLRTFCSRLPELTRSNGFLWTVVGEFTTASTDCECGPGAKPKSGGAETWISFRRGLSERTRKGREVGFHD